MTTPQPIPAGESNREIGLSPPQEASGRWRHLLSLFRSYWLSKDWKFAWFSIGVLLLYQFGEVYLLVAANRWQQNFFDSVEQREAAKFIPLLITFTLILVGQVLTSIVNSFVKMTLCIRWRTNLTKRYLTRWMGNNRFAEIERLRLIDNPDQRIADDINNLTGELGLLNIIFGVIGMVVGAITFGMILMETAESINFTLMGYAISIPGSTIWYAIIYALIGSFVITKIGAPFVRATMRQQHREADFRSNLIHVRRNAGQISFAKTVPTEHATLLENFRHVRTNFRKVIYGTLGINFGQGVYERIGSIIPLFLMVPRYYAGAISFGQVMGARDAFQTMVGQLSYIVQAYARIGTQIACLNRLKALDDAIDQYRPRGIDCTVSTADNVVLRADSLKVHRPNGAALLEVPDWTIAPEERWVVRGPSGAGKSTLLRAIVGLWPDGAGSVALHEGLDAMFVPQRLYLPLGTLKGSICFPDADDSHSDEEIIKLLDHVGLGDHSDHIHAVRFWQEELSPGEQQRIALARILLHRPKLLVLDEATSALDPDNARLFHERLLAAIPDLTLISVVHDDRLEGYHTHILSINQGRATGRAIGPKA